MTFVTAVIIWLLDTTYSSVLAFVLLKLLQVLLKSEVKRYKKKPLALDLEFLSLRWQMDQEGLTDDCDTAQGGKKGKRLIEWQLCDWKLNVGNKLMGVAEGQMHTHTHCLNLMQQGHNMTGGNGACLDPVSPTSSSVWGCLGHRGMKGTVTKKKRGRWWRDSFPHAGNKAFYTPSFVFFPR